MKCVFLENANLHFHYRNRGLMTKRIRIWGHLKWHFLVAFQWSAEPFVCRAHTHEREAVWKTTNDEDEVITSFLGKENADLLENHMQFTTILVSEFSKMLRDPVFKIRIISMKYVLWRLWTGFALEDVRYSLFLFEAEWEKQDKEVWRKQWPGGILKLWWRLE